MDSYFGQGLIYLYNAIPLVNNFDLDILWLNDYISITLDVEITTSEINHVLRELGYFNLKNIPYERYMEEEGLFIISPFEDNKIYLTDIIIRY